MILPKVLVNVAGIVLLIPQLYASFQCAQKIFLPPLVKHFVLPACEELFSILFLTFLKLCCIQKKLHKNLNCSIFRVIIVTSILHFNGN